MASSVGITLHACMLIVRMLVGTGMWDTCVHCTDESMCTRARRTSWGNFFMNITNTDDGYDCAHDTPQTREFFAMQLCHLEELYSKYNFAELWFDGGAPCLKEYEDTIAALTLKYQANAVAFQGPINYPNNIRWIGTEAGVAPCVS